MLPKTLQARVLQFADCHEDAWENIGGDREIGSLLHDEGWKREGLEVTDAHHEELNGFYERLTPGSSRHKKMSCVIGRTTQRIHGDPHDPTDAPIYVKFDSLKSKTDIDSNSTLDKCVIYADTKETLSEGPGPRWYIYAPKTCTYRCWSKDRTDAPPDNEQWRVYDLKKDQDAGDRVRRCRVHICPKVSER